MTVLHTIRFVVPGDPVAKGRPKFKNARSRAGVEFVQTYTPRKTRRYEDGVRFGAKVAMFDRQPLQGPVSLTVSAYLPIPASWPKWKQRDARSGVLLPIGKPDCDNLAKVCDGLNGIVFKDDACIVDLVVRKRYGLEPRLVIEVCSLDVVALMREMQGEMIGAEK